MCKKLLAALLILAMCLPFAACGKTEPDNTGDVSSDTTVVTEEEYKLPEYNFDGYEFKILSAGRGSVNTNDFLYNEENPTVIDSAVERRNKAVQDLYGIKIVTSQRNTTANQQSPEAYRVLVKEAMSGDYNYDMCVIPGYDVSQLAYEGYLSDLNQLPYFDQDNDWYDEKANDAFEFAGTLFFTTGDFGISMMDQTYCIAFNKKLAETYKVENLYDLVNEHKWTIDKMYSISKEVTDDTNGDGVTDVYGTLYWVDAVYGVVNSAGQKMVTLDPDTLNYELTINTEVTHNMLEKFFNMVMDPESSLKYQHNSAKKEYIPIFSGDQALFFMTTIGKLGEFRDMETDYGILPYVLYNEQQTEYANTVAPFYMNYLCVPLMVENEERTSAIIEAIGYYSHEYIIPAYYDKTLNGQYTRDEESSAMLDIIFETRAYDLGYCYQPANRNKHLIYMLNDGSFDWQSRYAKLEIPAQTFLDLISSALRKTAGVESTAENK